MIVIARDGTKYQGIAVRKSGIDMYVNSSIAIANFRKIMFRTIRGDVSTFYSMGPHISTIECKRSARKFGKVSLLLRRHFNCCFLEQIRKLLGACRD